MNPLEGECFPLLCHSVELKYLGIASVIDPMRAKWILKVRFFTRST